MSDPSPHALLQGQMTDLSALPIPPVLQDALSRHQHNVEALVDSLLQAGIGSDLINKAIHETFDSYREAMLAAIDALQDR